MVHFDPDEARNFIVGLYNTCEAVESANKHIKSRFNALNRTWRDEKYQIFSARLEEMMTAMDRFARDAEIYADHVAQRERVVRKYLSERMY